MIFLKQKPAYLVISLLTIIILFLSLPIQAQYFGQNKVQYKNFNFKIMKTKHFDIYYYQEDIEVVRQAAMMAERWYSRYSRIFNHELKGRQPLVLYSSGPEFQQTTVIPSILGEGTGGVTESFKRRIVLPYGVSMDETDHVIGHELVHAFQYDIAGQGHSDQARYTGADLRLPLFLIEGLAEYLSIGSVHPETSMWMRDSWERKDLPQIRKLEDYYKYFPYRYGHALWAYIGGRWGDEMIGKIFRMLARSGDYESVLQGVLGIPLKQLSEDWHKSMEEAYSPLVPLTEKPEAFSRLLLKGTEDNPYNVSPVLSPDGKHLIFFSSRDLFSIDLYLADSTTGKIKKKLTSTAIDPHFESIQFIRSAGSWSPDGQRFVLGTVSKGKPYLTIMNPMNGRIEKEIPFPELGEILNPSWSPDGRQIVFSALAGGVTDIFIYNLADDTIKQMTRDSFGDLHPVWSPDGQKIAFVTERFSANLEWLDSGHYELSLLDVASGEISRILGFPSGKNINPQWSEDGQSLYFLADYLGKTDLYRINLIDGKIYQITNLFTGIGGITELSPSISYSPENGRLAMSVYEGGNYSIYIIDSREKLTGQIALSQLGERPLGLLPPRTQPEGSLLGLLRNPLFGLPKDTDFPITDYKPKLSLDYISQPTVAVGVDRYGTYMGGGLAAFWSDMLGYHTLVTMAQTNYELVDSYFLVGYMNTRKRINWGAVAQRVPYIYGSYGAYYDEISGYPVYIEEEYLTRQINYQINGFAYYPFNTFRRLEMAAGFNLIDFNQKLYRWTYDLYTYQLIDYYQLNLPAGKSIKYGYVSAALVYDSSMFGACSPILGQSYVLQVQPTFGNLNFISLMADYRRYLVPVRPFTFAFRVLHYGRYGKGSDDSRLWPMYLGYENLVRGYDYYTFDYAEFDETNPEAFDFDRLFGSRMIVANVELRFPVFGVLGIGRGYYGVWPLEFLAFYDIGTAWYSGEKPDWFGGDKKAVSSAGVGLRTNLFGVIVLGFDYVYPFDRPIKGWHWQFTISPGF
ncbi:MAG: BamA/TamA family outer membrane protein [Acidobacteriota bacterium]|nr:BamA/TamA family outer membrane protein [Acidobacteriota bacterium]MDW3228505.1 BamA/TamA family outer membrane protein [Acidobacteriota bacterium]